MEKNKISVSDSVVVEVNAGEFGKYVKLHRGQKWINLSEKCWRFIKSNARWIDNSVKEESDYSLAITSGKEVRVSMYNNRRYVVFCEKFFKDGEELTKHVNLDEYEWKALKLRFGDINALLDVPLAYKVDGAWSFVKPKSLEGVEVVFWTDFDDDDINVILCAYLIETEIVRRSKAEFLKYEFKANVHDSAKFELLVDEMFDNVKKSINHYEYVSKLNQNLDWQVSPWFLAKSDAEIKEMVKGKQKFKPALTAMLIELFEHLEF